MSAKTRIRYGLGTVAAVLAVGGLLFGAGSAASAAPVGPVTAPANLHVVSQTFTDLNLAWDASSGSGVSYELFIDSNTYPLYPPDTPSVDVQLGREFGLIPGSTHTFQVGTFGGGTGSRAFSNKLTVTLGPGNTTAPSAPANLHVVSMNADGVKVGWEASGDPDSPSITYLVYNPCGVTTTATEATIPSQTAIPVCGIPTGSTSNIQIFARDPSGNQSPLSNPLTFTFTPQG